MVRILDITGMTASLHIEGAAQVPRLLGAEQDAGAPRPSAGAGLAAHRRQVTAFPADDDVVDSALRLVVTLARATVGGADGVSVSLRRHGQLATVAASDQTISSMDADQYATGEGPCVDASVQGRWFHAEDLDTETRWPAFTPRARTLGINAILSSPLVARDQPVGALNIYSRTAVAFAPKDQELASVFASEASSILMVAGLDVSDAQIASRLQEAQRTRQTIALAQGAIMEREGIDEDDAYTRLRELSERSSRTLQELAADVVAATSRSLQEGHDESGSHDG
jgi:GAF domain-containing protein